jgi:hypothetical protein
MSDQSWAGWLDLEKEKWDPAQEKANETYIGRILLEKDRLIIEKDVRMGRLILALVKAKHTPGSQDEFRAVHRAALVYRDAMHALFRNKTEEAYQVALAAMRASLETAEAFMRKHDDREREN